MQNNSSAPSAASKKNMIISGAVILVVIAALFFAPRLQKKASEEEVQDTKEEVAQESEVPKALSRADATAKYVGSIIRFSVGQEGECAASPETLSTTVRQTVMIDNDTDARRTIMVGSKTYSVGAHRYTLSSMNMGLGEHTVSCDGKTVSKITIQ